MASATPYFFNTLTRHKEPFEPLEPPCVRAYACGPTVYDHPHLGNFRYFIWVDVLHRYLRWRGYEVELVINLTDVDDKTIARAAAAGVDLPQFTERYARAFFDGLEALHTLPATHYPRATDHIQEMVELIERLLASGHAYRSDGSVFFRVASFPAYGRLARLDPEQMRSTERVEQDDFGKEDRRDFALWKKAKHGEPAWDAPFGRGRPGWHLECSAMSMKYLGTTFDLHLGGVDLVFPHHENEIAQSEAVTGEPFVRTWMHCSHLIVEGVKMSKSLGNFYTLAQLLERGHDPLAIRYLLASVHYRRQLNFTFEAVEQAASAITRLRQLVVRSEQEASRLPQSAPERTTQLDNALQLAREGFATALDDDLNTAGALGSLFTLVRETHAALDDGAADGVTLAAVLDWLREADKIWGLLPVDDPLLEFRIQHAGKEILARGPKVSAQIEALIRQRAMARAERDFGAADRLRKQLAELGIELDDTAQGVRWRRAGTI